MSTTLHPRRALLVGAGLAALGAGAWWAHRQATLLPPIDETDAAAFWRSEFERLDPRSGASAGRVALPALRGRPLLLNFWATWCPPCVKEMPELDQFAREHTPQGWQVLGLAIDQRDAVAKFLQSHPVGFTIALGGPGGLGLVRGLGNAMGGLPFTVAFSPDGQIAQRKIGATTLDELRVWAKAIARKA